MSKLAYIRSEKEFKEMKPFYVKRADLYTVKTGNTITRWRKVHFNGAEEAVYVRSR